MRLKTPPKRAVRTMSKSANPGELRTSVFFMKTTRTIDSEGYPVETPVNVFGDGVPCKCKWVNAHGYEALQGMQLQLKEPATITTRYSDKLLNPKLLVYKGTDTHPYEIISIDDVEDRHRWLEIKVQRKVGAR